MDSQQSLAIVKNGRFCDTNSLMKTTDINGIKQIEKAGLLGFH